MNYGRTYNLWQFLHILHIHYRYSILSMKINLNVSNINKYNTLALSFFSEQCDSLETLITLKNLQKAISGM